MSVFYYSFVYLIILSLLSLAACCFLGSVRWLGDMTAPLMNARITVSGFLLLSAADLRLLTAFKSMYILCHRISIVCYQGRHHRVWLLGMF